MSTGDHFLIRKAILINLFNPNHIGVKYSLVIFVRGGGMSLICPTYCLHQTDITRRMKKYGDTFFRLCILSKK